MLGLNLSLWSAALGKGVGWYRNSYARAAAQRFVVPLAYPMQRGLDEAATILADNGVLQVADGWWWLGFANSQQACINIAQNRFDLSLINSPTFTAYSGLAGNGVNAYADTGINAAVTSGLKLSQNDISAAIDVTTALANSGGSSFDFGSGNFRMSRNSDGSLGVRTFTSSTTNAVASPSYPAVLALDREAAAIWNVYKDGVDVGGGSGISTTPISETFQIGRAGSAGFGVNNVRMALVARHLTPTQHAAVVTAKARMVTAIAEATA